MKIISIDVGIKNMGVCILSFDEQLFNDGTTPKIQRKKVVNKYDIDKIRFTKIIEWKNINIINSIVSDSEIHNHTCEFIQKNNKKCSSSAIYYCKLNNSGADVEYHFFCKKHSNQTPYFLPTSTLYTKSSLNKKSITQLLEYKKEKNIYFGDDNDLEHNIKKNVKIYKKDVVDELHKYIENFKLRPIEKPKSHDISLVQTGIIIKEEFDKLLITELDVLKDIDAVVIENQISPIANRMKTIQGMISQYFIMNGIYNIEFISSANKLNNEFQSHLNGYKLSDDEFIKQNSKTVVIDNTNTNNYEPIQKGNEHYKERKTAGLSMAYKILKIMEGYYDHNFIKFFTSHKKKDDLADSLLQGVWYIYNNKYK